MISLTFGIFKSWIHRSTVNWWLPEVGSESWEDSEYGVVNQRVQSFNIEEIVLRFMPWQDNYNNDIYFTIRE